MRFTTLFLLPVFWLSTTEASGTTYSYEFTGRITVIGAVDVDGNDASEAFRSILPFSENTRITGSFSYSDGVVDSFAPPTAATYLYDNSQQPHNLSVTVGNVTIADQPGDRFGVSVVNDASYGDRIVVFAQQSVSAPQPLLPVGWTVSNGTYQFHADLVDGFGTVFSDDALPTQLSLDAFSHGTIRFSHSSPSSSQSNATLQTPLGAFTGTRMFFTGDIDSLVQTSPPPPPVPQFVVLAWGEDVPVQIVGELGLFGETYSSQPGTMLAAAIGTDPGAAGFRSAVNTQVNKLFHDAGINNLVISDVSVPGASTIYFTDETVIGLAGMAYTGVDTFNRDRSGEAVLFTPGLLNNVEDYAETIAHEIGHLLGLVHVSPPTAAEIMQAGKHDAANEMFNNVASPIDNFPLFIKHNPIYHLRRYVDGESHDDLVSDGIQPGFYDQEILEQIKLRLGFSDSSQTIHDVIVSVGNGDYTKTIARFNEITLGELAQLEFTVNSATPLQLVAASTPGGDLDIVLATGDPNDPNNLLIKPLAGDTQVFLQQHSLGEMGFTTIDDVIVNGSVVPEPSSVQEALGILVLLLFWRRRSRYADFCSTAEQRSINAVLCSRTSET